MNVNLIPAARLRRASVQRHLRAWITTWSSLALFLLVAFFVAGGISANDDRTLTEQITVATNTIEQGQIETTRLRSAIEHSMTVLRANRAVGVQPDWSILLALVAEALGDEMVIRECRLVAQPARDEETGNDLTLTISGIGRTQQDISQFVLRMDKLTLFRRVRLTDTRREPFLNDHAIAFRLECELDKQEESGS
ncbi:MAG: hypothetical protein HKO59_00465 [Phycisphaerales bacterium]|nr:PilN domain-containing protein [Phycisphaerae bacterium]NNF44185.1 hypothetical protein [Phycisphaerales bacterium]NNM24453.1 hypothetical protein [Phycisphaerales bacterium]